MKRIAEALVECGYGDWFKCGESFCKIKLTGSLISKIVNPFADTLEGRRQADALEDWLLKKHCSLWIDSDVEIIENTDYTTMHQWRLERIKCCFEQLGELE